MIAVKIEQVYMVHAADRSGKVEEVEQIIGTKMVVGETMGDCLDSVAPDPAENASWKIKLVSREVLHA